MASDLVKFLELNGTINDIKAANPELFDLTVEPEANTNLQVAPGGRKLSEKYAIWNTIGANVVHTEKHEERHVSIIITEMVCNVSSSNPDGRSNDMLKLVNRGYHKTGF